MDMCEVCFADVPHTEKIAETYVCTLCRRVAPRKLVTGKHQTELSNAELLLAMLRLGNELLAAHGIEARK